MKRKQMITFFMGNKWTVTSLGLLSFVGEWKRPRAKGEKQKSIKGSIDILINRTTDIYGLDWWTSFLFKCRISFKWACFFFLSLLSCAMLLELPYHLWPQFSNFLIYGYPPGCSFISNPPSSTRCEPSQLLYTEWRTVAPWGLFLCFLWLKKIKVKMDVVTIVLFMLFKGTNPQNDFSRVPNKAAICKLTFELAACEEEGNSWRLICFRMGLHVYPEFVRVIVFPAFETAT